jgi:hypothetical protein
MTSSSLLMAEANKNKELIMCGGGGKVGGEGGPGQASKVKPGEAGKPEKSKSNNSSSKEDAPQELSKFGSKNPLQGFGKSLGIG